MKKIIASTTMDVSSRKPSNDVYGYLIRAIIYQQLSGKAADTIYGRFLHLFRGAKIPSPRTLAKADVERLRTAGLSKQKANYVTNVAQFFTKKENKNCDWQTMTDEEIIEKLTTIKGVGTWTAQMVLMSCLARPDVLPTEDLTIRQRMVELYNIKEGGKAVKQRMIEIAEKWRPYRSYACLYLWRG